MQTRKALTLDDVKKVAVAAEAEAKKNNWAVTIAIVDDGGKPASVSGADAGPSASVPALPLVTLVGEVSIASPLAFFDAMVWLFLAPFAPCLLPLLAGRAFCRRDLDPILDEDFGWPPINQVTHCSPVALSAKRHGQGGKRAEGGGRS